MSPIRVWWLAARPKTLTAAVIPVLVGTALARAEVGVVQWDLFWCALWGAIFIQIGTNFVNDAADFKRGTDTQERLGPLRVTQAGLLTHTQVMRGAYVCFGVAALFGIPLIQAGGWPIVVIGICSIIAAYAYTAGPFPLAYLGLGDLFVIVFFGLVAVGGTYYLHAGEWGVPALVAGLCLGALATALLAVNNLRDRAGDAANHKKTLAVRFGEDFARREVQFMACYPFIVGAYWWMNGNYWASLLPLASIPLAWKLVHIARFGNGRELNAGLGKAAALHAVYGALLAAGLWIGAGMPPPAQ